MIATYAADVGNIVRQRRTGAGLTQAALAGRVGVSRKWLADLEKGHPRAELHLVLDTLNVLGALVDIIDAPRKGVDVDRLAVRPKPTVPMSPELANNLARIAGQAGLPSEVTESLERARQFTAIDLDQLASIRSAVADVELDEEARQVMRDMSKALVRAESNARGRPCSTIPNEQP